VAGTAFGGPWTLQKLEILERYLDSYTTALKNQPFQLIYVDAFAGEGSFRLNAEFYQTDYSEFRELYSGSSRIALGIRDKAFDKLVFSEIVPQSYQALNE
jgi:three-Cys-motif partner protein